VGIQGIQGGSLIAPMERLDALLIPNPEENSGKGLTLGEDNSKLIKGVDFMLASTKEDAQKYFIEILGLTSDDYTTMHLDVANMVNKEVKAVYATFGDVNAGGHLKGFQITTRLPPDMAASYSPSNKEVSLRKGDVMYGTSLAKMGANAQKNQEAGYWSTNKPEHAVRHELGHAVGYWLTEADAIKRNKISVLRNQLLRDSKIEVWDRFRNTKEQKLAAGRLISYYALKEDKELIAEAIAEYMAGNPREAARKVVEILIGG
jgi:hypothetical protein